MRTVDTTDRITVPIRVDGDLYRAVAKLAQDQRRTVRAQFELLVEQSIGVERVERRGARRG